jgi:chromosome partitioning protein
MTIIAIVCHKGGVAKTTSAATLGVALATDEPRRRVLLADLDFQASLTTSFGVNPEERGKTIYHALLEEGTQLTDVLVPVREGLDLAPANRDLAAAESLLLQEQDGDLYLRQALAPARDQYDYLLLDCPPNLGRLTINALVAANYVLIPVNPSFLAVKALGQLMQTITLVQERRNPSLALMGILLTRVNRTLHAAEVETRVRHIFPNHVFTTTISQSVRFEEAPAAGKTILDYDPFHPGALAYRALAKEIITYGQ